MNKCMNWCLHVERDAESSLLTFV